MGLRERKLCSLTWTNWSLEAKGKEKARSRAFLLWIFYPALRLFQFPPLMLLKLDIFPRAGMEETAKPSPFPPSTSSLSTTRKAAIDTIGSLTWLKEPFQETTDYCVRMFLQLFSMCLQDLSLSMIPNWLLSATGPGGISGKA